MASLLQTIPILLGRAGSRISFRPSNQELLTKLQQFIVVYGLTVLLVPFAPISGSLFYFYDEDDEDCDYGFYYDELFYYNEDNSETAYDVEAALPLDMMHDSLVHKTAAGSES